MEKKRTYGVWAVRSSTSIFGPAQSWCKENGKPLEFDTKAAAENYAKEANEHTTANVRYYVKEKEPEPGAVRKGTWHYQSVGISAKDGRRRLHHSP